MNRRPALIATQRKRRDKGYALAMMALLIIPLFAITGFAIDVGAWYFQANRLQRTADAAALAGVIYQPDIYTATAVAKEVAAANGFVDGVNDIVVDVINVNNTRLTVQITDNSVSRFVTQIVDDSAVKIVRSSTAEYIKPIPLGSPTSIYGNNPGAATNPNFWASIAGPYYDFNGGDPYATKCKTKPIVTAGAALQPGNSCSTSNPDYRPDGYLFAVDVPAWAVGTTLTVALYDAGNYDDPTPPATLPAANDFWEVNTTFQLFDSDATPLDYSDNPPLPTGTCGVGRDSTLKAGVAGLIGIMNGANPATYHNAWYTLCTVTVTHEGVFPLQVKSSGFAGYGSMASATTGDGSNQFSIKASVSSAPPTGERNVSVYALRDMSVYTNPDVPSGSGYAEFFLSEIPSSASGKNLTIELFDPGDSTDSAGNFVLDMVAPLGSFGSASGAVTSTVGTIGQIPRCKSGERGQPLGALTTCSISTKVAGQTSGLYNGKWLQIQIPLTDYSCSTDCWWRVVYRFSGGAPADRTVWLARVSGDPVRVVS